MSVTRPAQRTIDRAVTRARSLDPAVIRGEAEYTSEAHCLCGDAISAHKGKGHRGECLTCGRAVCARYREDVVDRLVRGAVAGATVPFTANLAKRRQEEYAARPKTEHGPGQWSVRASDLNGCRREIGYRNGLDPDAEAVPKSHGEALAGTIVEAAVVEVHSTAYPWREYQHEVVINGLHSPGRVDEYDPVIGMVCEIKSAGEWMWEQVITFGPQWYHLGQALLYAAAMEAAGEFVSFVRLHYVKRDTFEEETFDTPWDDDARSLVETYRARLIGILTELDIAHATGVLPDRDRSGPTHPLCVRCDWLEACWSVPRAVELGRDPMSLTLLGEHPDSKRIAWAVQEIVRLRTVKTDATREYDDARHMLDKSIPPAIYEGVAKVERGRRGGIAYKEWTELLAAEIERLGGDPMDVPIPRNEDGAPVAKLVAVKERTKVQAAQEGAA